MARLAALFLGLALAAHAALAAPPVPPDQVAYPGVLVDGGGLPLAGPVDLTARLYDAASGGTLIFKQSFSGVGLSDGHFTLNLGPAGEATDSPANPLTTSLRTALAGDLVAGAGRFVEITVEADPPLARVQLLLVPYALRADHATTSDVATQSLDTQAVNGLDGIALQALFEVYNDDGGPPSNDPREGTVDVDGDGLVNFVDPDNDNDGLSDTLEIANGTDINLMTPTIASVTPNSGQGDQITQVTVTGNGFESGLTALLGTQAVNVSNLTATSFQADVGPDPGPYPLVLDLLVTNANGEVGGLGAAFTFEPQGAVPIPLPFTLAGANLPVGIVAQGEELLIFGTQKSVQNTYAVDTIADGTIAFNRVLNFNNSLVPSVLGWNAGRVLHALRGTGGSTDQIQLFRDTNNDQVLGSGEFVVLESPGDNPRTHSPALAFDGSGRPGGGYLRQVGSTSTAIAFHDRDGDGLFTGTNELVTIEPVGGSTAHLGDGGFDASGRLAYVYYDPGNQRIRAAYDRSGDGDFDDSPGGIPELATVASLGLATPPCLDMSFDGAGRLAILYVIGGNPQLLYDRNGDGDFLDAGESQSLPGSGTSTGCDLGTSALSGRILIVHNPGSEVRLLVDINDDGDFADAAEDAGLGGPIAAPLAVTSTATGGVRVLAPQGVVVAPVR